MLASAHSPIIAAGPIAAGAATATGTANLIIHGEDNGKNEYTFIDSSQYNRTLTRYGSATQTPWSPFGANWSHFFNYNNYGTGTGPTISSGPFTLELFVKIIDRTTSPQYFFYSKGSTTFHCIGWSGSQFIARLNSTTDIGFGGTLTVAKWMHIALVRDASNSCVLYVNGKATGTPYTYTGGFLYNSSCNVGGEAYAPLSGFLSNVRLTNTAVYTSEFTPPTSPLTAIPGTKLLAAVTNRVKDLSPSNYSMTSWNGDAKVYTDSPFAKSTAYDPAVDGASAYFADVNSYVDTPNSADFILDGDFSIEGWFYQETRAGDGTIFEIGNGNSGDGILFRVGTSAYDTVKFRGTTVVSASQYFPLTQWNHFAVTRLGGQVSIYANGTRVYTATNTNVVNSAGDKIRIGNITHSTAAQGFNGFISNFRVLKGECPYSGATITLPTAPFVDIGGTQKLLCLFANARTFDPTTKGVIVSNSTTTPITIDNTSYKIGSGSISVSPTNGLRILASHPSLRVDSNANPEFTIEGWFKPGATVTYGILIRTATNASGYTYFDLRIWNGVLTIWASTSGASWSIWDATPVGFTPTANTWFHVAIVKNSTTLKVFVNGTAKLSKTMSTFGKLNAITPNPHIIVGNGAVGAAYWPFDGNVDEITFVNYAKYSADFVPSLIPTPDQ